MDFVFDQMRELQHVGIANGDRLVEWLTRSTVEQLNLARFRQTSASQKLLDIFFRSSVKHRRGNLDAQRLGCPAQMCLHNLPNIHAVRYTQWVQDDIHRCLTELLKKISRSF